MKLKIDQFYLDRTQGVLKFLGHKEGFLVFDKYERSFDPRQGWLPTGQRFNIEPEFQARRIKAKRLRPIPPPQ